MVKIIFQDAAHRVLKRVYGCERVLHCRWNIWFGLARPRPVTHRAGLMQGACPNVTLTIHLWLAAGPQQVLLQALLDDLFLWASRTRSGLPCDNCFKRYDRPGGLAQVMLTLQHPGLNKWTSTAVKQTYYKNITHNAKYSWASIWQSKKSQFTTK